MTKQEKAKQYNKTYVENNREAFNERKRLKYAKTREEINEKRRKYYDKIHNNPEHKERRSKYYTENKDIILTATKSYYKKRRATDPLFKTKTNYANSINAALRKNGYTKKSRSYEILGCTFEELNKHLVYQFDVWMTWDNRGLYKKDTYNYGWDIDHIIPTSSAQTEDELIKLFHYTNLRPLCSKINRDIKKGRQ